MVFSADMVHILPGYPMESPYDPIIVILAFYLQLPQGFPDNVVRKDLLRAIVKSDMSSIGESIGGTILSVQSSPSTTGTPEGKVEDKRTGTIVGASVGGAVFVIIVAILLGFKISNK